METKTERHCRGCNRPIKRCNLEPCLAGVERKAKLKEARNKRNKKENEEENTDDQSWITKRKAETKSSEANTNPSEGVLRSSIYEVLEIEDEDADVEGETILFGKEKKVDAIAPKTGPSPSNLGMPSENSAKTNEMNDQSGKEIAAPVIVEAPGPEEMEIDHTNYRHPTSFFPSKYSANDAGKFRKQLSNQLSALPCKELNSKLQLGLLKGIHPFGLEIDVILCQIYVAREKMPASLKLSAEEETLWNWMLKTRRTAIDPSRRNRNEDGQYTADELQFCHPSDPLKVKVVIRGVIIQWNFVSSPLLKGYSPRKMYQVCLETVPLGTSFRVYISRMDSNSFHCRIAIKPFPVVPRTPIPLNLPQMQVAAKPIKKTSGTSPRYLVIIDFEATCDFSPVPLVTPENSEIIEFPWIVLDMENNMEVVETAQYYVTPTDIETITDYCSALTGITREKCSNAQAVSLRNAISIFGNSMKALQQNGDSAIIVTDGVWDLQVQLRNEAKRKGIELPYYFNFYFDLKSEFQRTFPLCPNEEGAPPLFVMLQTFSLHFFGRSHSGIDDCNTIARVIAAIRSINGSSFDSQKTLKIIPSNYDPMKDQSWIHFTGTCPPLAWKCGNVTSESEKRICSIWNNPWLNKCLFCGGHRSLATEVNVGKSETDEETQDADTNLSPDPEAKNDDDDDDDDKDLDDLLNTLI